MKSSLAKALLSSLGGPMEPLRAKEREQAEFEQAGARDCGRRRGASQFRGVTRHARTGRWEAHLWVAGKQTYLGGYIFEEQAALAYDIAAVAYKGREANTNCELGQLQAELEAYQQAQQAHQQAEGTSALAAPFKAPEASPHFWSVVDCLRAQSKHLTWLARQAPALRPAPWEQALSVFLHSGALPSSQPVLLGQEQGPAQASGDASAVTAAAQGLDVEDAAGSRRTLSLLSTLDLSEEPVGPYEELPPLCLDSLVQAPSDDLALHWVSGSHDCTQQQQQQQQQQHARTAADSPEALAWPSLPLLQLPPVDTSAAACPPEAASAGPVGRKLSVTPRAVERPLKRSRLNSQEHEDAAALFY